MITGARVHALVENSTMGQLALTMERRTFISTFWTVDWIMGS